MCTCQLAYLVTTIVAQRDHYEGTQFDLTKGLAAGPYGNPNRFDPAPVDNMTLVEAISGSYERSISMFRTAYSVVSQARAAYPGSIGARVWFCPSTSRAGAYVPMYVSAEQVHSTYTTGSLFKYSRSVAFWLFDAVSNYACEAALCHFLHTYSSHCSACCLLVRVPCSALLRLCDAGGAAGAAGSGAADHRGRT